MLVEIGVVFEFDMCVVKRWWVVEDVEDERLVDKLIKIGIVGWC